jgi:cytochrome c biogenesis protein CcdA
MTGWAAIGWALWLGILTSVSPCPLASNIAAISFIGRQVGRTRQVLLSGLLYTLGRTVAYVILAALILVGLLASDAVARFLQRHLSQILGPVLILVGMLLLGMLGTRLSFNLAGHRATERLAHGGAAGAGSAGSAGGAAALGFLLALSFCPVSAGLYFGGLIPMAAANGSRVGLPALFGVGTALPVLVFAFLIAFASQKVGQAFDRLTQVERAVRTITGVVFIVVGIYYCLTGIYGVG